MNEHNLPPEDSLFDNSNEDNELNPKFDLQKFNIGIEDIKQEVEELSKIESFSQHMKILNELLKQFEPIDFEKLAFPQIEALNKKIENPTTTTEEKKEINKKLDKLIINSKHYLVLSIENVIKLAEKNNWGLCKNYYFIYLFNGSFWEEIDKESFQKFLGEAAEKMGVSKYSAKYFQFRDLLFKQFLSEAYLPTPENDKDKVLINLQNGTFEISPQGNNLRPFERADFITYQLPFEYNKDSEAPIFKTYLDKVLPDKERQNILAEYLGYVFIKHGSKSLKEEKALVLYGTGANGKSVFFEIVNALLGVENISSFSLQSLTNENGYYRAKLANKLLNYASEINGNLEASIFKLLVSGEPVEARLPYGQPFSLKQYAKLIFNCNELPKDVEQTNAYFRRFLIIPFDVTIPPHEQDKQLHIKIIENELSGVFNWVLDGLERLLIQKRFSDCEAAQKAVEKYRIESDSVQMFLSEMEYTISTFGQIPLKDMYSDYKTYCTENFNRTCAKKTFSERLKNSGFQIDRKSIGMSVNAEKKVYSRTTFSTLIT